MSETKAKIYWMGEDIETLSREKLIEIIITLNAALIQIRSELSLLRNLIRLTNDMGQST